MAKLTFYYGTMSSGKTIDLIQTAYKYSSKGLKTLIVKPLIDTKGNNSITSRIGLSKEADILLDLEDSIFNYDIKNTSVMLVDEAQFLSKKQIRELFILTKELDIPVICYGLKTDFQGNLFEGSSELFALADQFDKLRSICATKDCTNNASFNARKVNGEYVYDGEQILIGEDESYDPLCSECYIEKVLKLKSNDYKNMVKSVWKV